MRVLKITSDMTKDEMTAEYRSFLRTFGAGFHPDTDAKDYIETSGGPTYTADEAEANDKSMWILRCEIGNDVFVDFNEVFNIDRY